MSEIREDALPLADKLTAELMEVNEDK